MCGIFGIVTGPRTELTPKSFRNTTRKLFRLAESRGKEASGLALRAGEHLFVHKEPVPAGRLIRTASYGDLFTAALTPSPGAAPGTMPRPLALIGHSRMSTNGAEAVNSNNQPVVARGAVCVHNGIIVNVDDLWHAFPELSRRFEVDTEVFASLIRLFHERTGSLTEAAQQTYERIEGSASVGMLVDDVDSLLLTTNTGSLYTCAAEGLDVFLFASERFMLEQLLRRRP